MREKIAAIRKAKEDAKKSTPEQPQWEPKQEPQSSKKTWRHKKGKWLGEKECPICHIFFKPRRQNQRTCCAECGALAVQEFAWRPPEYDQADVEQKLWPFLRIWLNLKEACLECDFPYSTIQQKRTEWTWFANFIEKCQNYIVIKAKQKLFKHMSQDWWDDPQDKITTRWLLERKRPEEYVAEKKKAEQEVINAVTAPSVIEQRFTQINIVVSNKAE
jgi:hypothetical protein